MPAIVDSYIYEGKVPELHHYTTWDGLHGIISSQTLWATDYRYLNDSTEVSHFKSYFQRSLRNHLKSCLDTLSSQSEQKRRQLNQQGGSISLAANLASEYSGLLFDPRGGGVRGVSSDPTPYICCFCSHRDDNLYEQKNGLLSQWRGYGGNESFCIVFDTQGLQEVIEQEAKSYPCHIFLTEVVYDDGYDEFQDFFGPAVRQLGDFMIDSLTQKGKRDYRRLAEILRLIQAGAIRFKRCAFYEEREVRIAYFRNISPPKEPKLVKSRGSNAIEYVSLFDQIASKPLPIRRVIVGPHRDQKALVVKARGLLGDKIEITLSETPYIAPSA
jgi:hypothetical protein